MTIIDRYASAAVGTRNMRSDPDTHCSDSDVVGAVGLAGKAVRTSATGETYAGAPLAMLLQRLFVGDNRGASEVVEVMADMAHRFAGKSHVRLKRVQAEDIARAVLAWHRDGTCRTCGGHGFDLTPGDRDTRRALTDRPCPKCKGTGRIPFERQFPIEQQLVANWLLTRVQEEQSKAGPAAMAALAPRLDL